MSSEASSEQLCVREGVGYDEVYSSGQNDLGASYSKRVPSANLPSEEEDEDSDVDKSESDTNRDSDGEENVENVESPIRSIIGPDSLRNFVLPLMWTVNDFNSTIKEQMFKAGFRLPLSAIHRCLLQYLGLAVTQIALNAYRIFLGAEVLYGVLIKGRRQLTVEEFFHCYCPSEIVKSRDIYSFLPRKPSLRRCTRPLIPTGTGRTSTSSSRETTGYATPMNGRTCPLLIELGE